MSSGGAGGAGGDAWFSIGGRFGPTRAAKFRLPCKLVGVYPVGITDEGLPSRVMSELAPIILGRDEFTCGLS